MAFWIRDNNIFCLWIYNLGKVNTQTIVKEKSWFCLADFGSISDFLLKVERSTLVRFKLEQNQLERQFSKSQGFRNLLALAVL